VGPPWRAGQGTGSGGRKCADGLGSEAGGAGSLGTGGRGNARVAHVTWGFKRRPISQGGFRGRLGTRLGFRLARTARDTGPASGWALNSQVTPVNLVFQGGAWGFPGRGTPSPLSRRGFKEPPWDRRVHVGLGRGQNGPGRRPFPEGGDDRQGTPVCRAFQGTV
jgi:hypothetical protein